MHLVALVGFVLMRLRVEISVFLSCAQFRQWAAWLRFAWFTRWVRVFKVTEFNHNTAGVRAAFHADGLVFYEAVNTAFTVTIFDPVVP